MVVSPELNPIESVQMALDGLQYHRYEFSIFCILTDCLTDRCLAEMGASNSQNMEPFE